MRTKGTHLYAKGHEWFIQPIKVKIGERCPKWQKNNKSSHGERLISNLLEFKEVEFIR